jgi:hypothetical protein
MYTCPVCAYEQLRYPPIDFTICPCCGTEFGYQDARKSFSELRVEWIYRGMRWHSNVVRPPLDWNGVKQLLQAGYLPVSNIAMDNSSHSEKKFGRSGSAFRFSWAV